MAKKNLSEELPEGFSWSIAVPFSVVDHAAVKVFWSGTREDACKHAWDRWIDRSLRKLDVTWWQDSKNAPGTNIVWCGDVFFDSSDGFHVVFVAVRQDGFPFMTLGDPRGLITEDFRKAMVHFIGMCEQQARERTE